MTVSPYTLSPPSRPAAAPVPSAAVIGEPRRTQDAARPSSGPAMTAASIQNRMLPGDSATCRRMAVVEYPPTSPASPSSPHSTARPVPVASRASTNATAAHDPPELASDAVDCGSHDCPSSGSPPRPPPPRAAPPPPPRPPAPAPRPPPPPARRHSGPTTRSSRSWERGPRLSRPGCAQYRFGSGRNRIVTQTSDSPPPPAQRRPAKRAPRRVKDTTPAADRPVAKVAVDIPLAHLDRPFDYLVPERMGAAGAACV